MREESSQQEVAPLDQRIAARVRALRAEQGLSLEGLAAASGVSRSMISLVERGESSPTAVVLEKLGRGLGLTLSALLAPGLAEATPRAAPPSPLARREEQPTWQDPASGYLRRALSPPGTGQPLLLTEVTFPPRAHVAFENGHLARSVVQQVWMLEGTMEIACGETRHTLREGDCLAMNLAEPTSFHNNGRKPARYLVALANGASSKERTKGQP